MAHTNNTEHYELSQFLATDKPAWLTDYNTDMAKIDTAMNGMQGQMDDDKAGLDAAVEVLQDRATSCENRLTEVEGRATDLEGRMTTAEGRLDVDEANITGNTNRVGVLEGKVADLEAGQGLAPDSITTAMLQDRCVTTDKIALNSVTTDEILNGTIQYEDLSEDCIRHFDPSSNNETLLKVINALYPVGSVYLGMGVDPNALFSGTTWVRVSGGVLYTGDGSNDGQSVGSDTKTLITANLPSHNHSATASSSVSGGGGEIKTRDGSYKATLYLTTTRANIGTETVCYGAHSDEQSSSQDFLAGGNISVSTSVSIGNTGSGTPFDVKQAGVNVSVWKRTA